MAPWCSGYHYCTTSFNEAWTQVLRRFKPCSRRVGDSRWWGSLTMVPAGNKAKRLSSVNHTTKTIRHHHHHHHQAFFNSKFWSRKNAIVYSVEKSSPAHTANGKKGYVCFWWKTNTRARQQTLNILLILLYQKLNCL